MKYLILFVLVASFIVGCIEISGKETPGSPSTVIQAALQNNVLEPRDELRVGRMEAMQMRKRRGKDDSSFKISAKDLQALMASTPAANDSFVFYFVQYDANSQREKDRYLKKVPTANWSEIAKKPSSVLVGFVGGGRTTMHLAHKQDLPVIPVYDLAVVCPPPPNCACEIAQ
jgi:hypothetical protein